MGDTTLGRMAVTLTTLGIIAMLVLMCWCFYCSAECFYAECHYAQWHYVESCYVDGHFTKFRYTKRHSDDCCNTASHYTDYP